MKVDHQGSLLASLANPAKYKMPESSVRVITIDKKVAYFIIRLHGEGWVSVEKAPLVGTREVTDGGYVEAHPHLPILYPEASSSCSLVKQLISQCAMHNFV